MARPDKGKQLATAETQPFDPEGRDFEKRKFVRVATTLSDMVKIASRDTRSCSSNYEDDDVLRKAVDPSGDKPLLGGVSREAQQSERQRVEDLAQRLAADVGTSLRLLDKYLLPSGKRRYELEQSRSFYRSMEGDMARIMALFAPYQTLHGPLSGVGPVQQTKALSLLDVLDRRVENCRTVWAVKASPLYHHSQGLAQTGPASAAAHLQHLAAPQRPDSACGGSAKSSTSARLASKLKNTLKLKGEFKLADKFKSAGQALKLRSKDKKPLSEKPAEEEAPAEEEGSSSSSSSSSSNEETGETSWLPPELPENTAFDSLAEDILAADYLSNDAIENIDSTAGFLETAFNIMTGFLSVLEE